MICPCWFLSTAVIIASLQSLGNGAMAGQGQKPLTLASIGEKDFNARSPFTQDFNVVANDILEQWKVPGMSIAIVDGHDVFAKGFGLATLPDTPSTPETLFYVGSTTKAQTAALMAQLIDSKAYPALSRGWSTPISSILRDDFLLQDEWATSHITLDDAASHRTGMAAHDNSWHREINGSKASLQDIVRGLHVNQILKEHARDMQCDIQKADDILFPERPKYPYPPSVILSELTGFYSNLGYGRFNLVQQQLSANSDQTVLVADRTELLWAQQWRLRHVSGNYWTLYSKMLLGINTVTRFYAAEFKIGVSGKVTGLEVSMYDRYGGVDEGTVLFHKVGGNTDG
ncbi:beta-lactamase [Hirsutella rhossiliensis]|uniref:Beta-lactamase domain-containing protein n=1 Tax=Hirsutella rhossiliensis TaxID=111463 RepID=A0A9P8N994_9HYPO|nr:beta-lactamase domain-containing protein [Hirsutella rhossiliensis]KAH0968857.1 beta-lactamase domain-containing protein [Hirsutella rhossiliensis]